MKRLFSIPAFILSTILLTACGGGSESDSNHANNMGNEQIETPTGIQVNYEVLHSSKNGNNKIIDTESRIDAVTKVIDNAQDYHSELSKFSNELAKNVDFSKQRVVFKTLGTSSYIGRDMNVIKAYDDNDKEVKVLIEVQSPAANCPVAQAFSLPYVFIVVDTTKPIDVKNKAIEKTC